MTGVFHPRDWSHVSDDGRNLLRLENNKEKV